VFIFTLMFCAQALAKVPAPTAAIMLTCVPLSLSPLFPSNHPIHANQTSTPWLKTGISDKIDAQINATQQSVRLFLHSLFSRTLCFSIKFIWFFDSGQFCPRQRNSDSCSKLVFYNCSQFLNLFKQFLHSFIVLSSPG
jgi:hypothetical protein